MESAFDIAADLDTPVSAYLKLTPFRPRFLLESVVGGERLARYSFVGFGEADEFRLVDDRCVINGETPATSPERVESPLKFFPGDASIPHDLCESTRTGIERRPAGKPHARWKFLFVQANLKR